MGVITIETHTITSVIKSSSHQVDNTMNHVGYFMHGVSNDMLLIGKDINQMSKPIQWMDE